MYKIVRSILFLLDAEKAHKVSFRGMKVLFYIPFVKQWYSSKFGKKYSNLRKEVMGLTFENPIGLAAGFDKNGTNIDALSNFGFGFIEVGTVTPVGQEGNQKPRLFRLKEDEGIINRMGFNNNGVEELISNLKKVRNKNLIIGGNIGKNKLTPNENAVEDYKICFDQLHEHVDYFVVNVSSPNTPNLRALQEKEPLKAILSSLQDLNKQKTNLKPILLKIAPDLTDSQLDDIIEIVQETGIEGVIANNTTISREGLSASKTELEAIGAGGLSGGPLTARSNDVVKYLRAGLPTSVIVGVGGIMTANQAKERLESGADLVQVYSGFVYGGPDLIKNIKEELKNS